MSDYDHGGEADFLANPGGSADTLLRDADEWGTRTVKLADRLHAQCTRGQTMGIEEWRDSLLMARVLTAMTTDCLLLLKRRGFMAGEAET
ncbi:MULTISPECIES: hypothetical protein [Dyella]|uniref:Uncharacterized protein n=2 Tax=Dyella TaxID=231454 RepID=A0A4R0Z0J5_9GAMM|nr:MULTISPECIES: hypothetical protein [Dyella]TBR39258.1 hypothetical protein EYV96_03260 [Dyella terrae]TCI13154.1 hypothetical protein EZM97_07605 [Dyella soli]